MTKLAPFLLEDFHARYEHRPGINLATSDALYWSLPQLIRKVPAVRGVLKGLVLSYPDGALLRAPLQQLAGRRHVAFPTSGASDAIFLALAALGLQRRGAPLRVALPRPAFGAFAGVAEMLRCACRYYDYAPARGWSIDEHELLARAGDCDVVVANTPHNPTGSVLAPSLLRKVAAALQKRGKHLLLDQVFALSDDASAPARLAPNMLQIGSLSKVHGLPGLRLGWLLVPKDLASSVRKLQQYTTLSLNSFAVQLGAVLLPRLDELGRGAHLRKNRALLLAWAEQNRDIVALSRCEAGTTVVLELQTRASEQNVFATLLAEKVLLAPGAQCFGVAGRRSWFRLGYGRDTDELERALTIIRRVLTRTFGPNSHKRGPRR
jgi:aspartate/methionine/tyrosine aminotransferase